MVDKVDPCNTARLETLVGHLQNLTFILHSVVSNPYSYFSCPYGDVDYETHCTGDPERNYSVDVQGMFQEGVEGVASTPATPPRTDSSTVVNEQRSDAFIADLSGDFRL